MGVIVSSLMTADGIRREPMTWIGDFFDLDAVEGSLAQLKEVDAFLMGRGSYDYFAPAWSHGGDPYSDALAALPKYVYSRTLEGADWPNTTVVRGDAVEHVRSLGGTTLLYGFGRLAQSLLAAGLVEQLHFGLHPLVLEPARTTLRLDGVERRDNGAVVLRYTT
jgi:dihydrofolate reductase